MDICCLDLEGVLIPEMWIKIADQTGIDDLRLTTRDLSSYDELMRHRLSIVERHNLDMKHIRDMLKDVEPLAGALPFLKWLHRHFLVFILSDTFYEFITDMRRKLNDPIILCHHLEISAHDQIKGYRLRQPDSKRVAVHAFQKLGYRVLASGDSYNDVTMLQSADTGVWYCPSEEMRRKQPQFQVATTYQQLADIFRAASRCHPPAFSGPMHARA